MWGDELDGRETRPQRVRLVRGEQVTVTSSEEKCVSFAALHWRFLCQRCGVCGDGETASGEIWIEE